MLSGLAVTVEDRFLPTFETRLADGSWQLAPDEVYFYPEAGSCRPSGRGLFWDGGDYLYGQFTLTVENTDGHAAVTGFSSTLSSNNTTNDRRTNRYLDEIAEAAVECRVFFGTNRMVNYTTVDYSETHMLSLKEPVTPALVPADTLPGDRCLYYVFFFTDGSRKDVILDPETGEILDETFLSANDP